MSHNINFNEQTGRHSFFSVKQKAWHGLGQIVSDYPNSKDAITFAGLDYKVEKRKLLVDANPNQLSVNEEINEVPEIEVPNFLATIRTDTQQVLGVVGKDYEVVQNTEAFNFFDAIIEGEGIQYETAGALGNGERIFITAKLPGYIKVGSDDLIEKYLFLTTSHDGFGSITAAFTPIRIVCQNTLNAALVSCSNCIKIRHTQNAKERLDEAHKVMGITNKLSEQLENIFNHWTKISVTDSEIKKLIQQAMAPSKEVLNNLQSENFDQLSTCFKFDQLSTCFKNICDNVYEYGISNPTQQMNTTKGTLFGAYNSITGYFQNVRRYKNEEAKLKSIMYGTALQRTQQAFGLCENFARYGNDVFFSN